LRILSQEYAQSWRRPVSDEFKAHGFNQTWWIVPEEPSITEISSLWVFKVEYNTDGSVDRLEARLVVRGFPRAKGIEHQEISSPVVRLGSVRLLIYIRAQNDQKFAQFDEVTALNGSMEEDIREACLCLRTRPVSSRKVCMD